MHIYGATFLLNRHTCKWKLQCKNAAVQPVPMPLSLPTYFTLCILLKTVNDKKQTGRIYFVRQCNIPTAPYTLQKTNGLKYCYNLWTAIKSGLLEISFSCCRRIYIHFAPQCIPYMKSMPRTSSIPLLNLRHPDSADTKQHARPTWILLEH